jgi:acetyl-CoA synthetase
VICTDIGYRRGKVIDLKGAVDEAVQGLSFCRESVPVYRRDASTQLNENEVDLKRLSNAQSTTCEAARLIAKRRFSSFTQAARRQA